MIDQSDEPDYYRFILRLKTIREPAEKAVYCSVQLHLAGGVLKNATRTSLPDLFGTLIAAPLGIDRYYLPLTPTRDMYGAGGVRLTARSWAKIAQMYLDDGVWKGKRILDSDSVEHLAVLQIFAHDSSASGRHGAANDECVPKRDGVQAVQVDGRKNQLGTNDDHVQARQRVHLPAGAFRGNAELTRCDDEVLL